jgi:hypothetical protein
MSDILLLQRMEEQLCKMLERFIERLDAEAAQAVAKAA